MIYKLENDSNFEFFEADLLKERKHIHIALSCGTDSSLILYMLAKEIDERLGYEYEIYPICGLDVDRPDFTNELNSIINYVKSQFTKVKIHKLKSYPYNKQNKNYTKKLYDGVNEIKDKINSVYVEGDTRNIEESLCKETNTRVKRRDDNLVVLEQHNRFPELLHYRPFGQHDKFTISWFYEQFDLMEGIYPYTLSCVNPKENNQPCEECYWCQEKFLTFGTFDLVKSFVEIHSPHITSNNRS